MRASIRLGDEVDGLSGSVSHHDLIGLEVKMNSQGMLQADRRRLRIACHTWQHLSEMGEERGVVEVGVDIGTEVYPNVGIVVKVVSVSVEHRANECFCERSVYLRGVLFERNRNVYVREILSGRGK